MQIARQFTTAGAAPFSDISFTTVNIEICHADPSQRVCVTDFEVPAHWSYSACEFLVRRYLRKAGVPAKCRPVEEAGVPAWLWRSVANEEALGYLPEEERYGAEISSRQIFHRLAGAWTYWGWKYDYFDTEADARAFYDECCYLMAAQTAAPASPQWLNTGLHWAYGIDGPAQGHFYVDPQTGKVCKSTSAYQHPQHHHCFIQGVRDELVSEGGIMDLWEREARVFKYGSGAGCNMSTIRGAKESLSGGAPSVGLMRFLSIGDKAAGAIKSGGNATQVEKMVLVDIDHPDIESFIVWKMQEEYKAASLLAGARQMRKYLSDIMEALQHGEGDARFAPESNVLLKQALQQARRAMIPESQITRVIDYARQGLNEIVFPLHDSDDPQDLFLTIGAHQARLAVRVSDDYMLAAAEARAWPLIGRVSGDVTATPQADVLMHQLAQSAWATGDPSVQFGSTINAWHGCRAEGNIAASSPRGEYYFLNDTACDIAVLNLLHFVDASGEFALGRFEHVARMMVLMLDISITMGQYPSREIASNTYRFRPIGLSYCNLAAMLMQMGYAYDSPEARAVAAAVSAVMTGAGYVASAELARELGAFEAFSENRDGMMHVLWRHHEAAFGRSQFLGSEQVMPAALDQACLPDTALADAVQRLWDLAIIKGDEYGYSNAQVSLVAASPNVMQLLDADSMATSPDTHLLKWRNQPEGGVVKYIPQQVRSALQTLGYQPLQVQDMMNYLSGTGSLMGAPAIDHDALRAKGFGVQELARIEETLAHVTHLRHAFDPFVIGERFCRITLGLNDLQMHDAAFDLLRFLGFGDDEIEQANAFACGAGTLADAPHLRDEDMAVFAVQSDITPQAQIAMMAAVQPFVSGGISHTICLHKDTTITTCRDWLELAWKSGLKSLSLQREGCGLYDAPVQQIERPVRDFLSFAPSKPTAIYHPRVLALQMARGHVAGREALPTRRDGFTQKAIVGDHTVYLRTGEYADGRLGEIFLDMPKQPAGVRDLVQQFAIAISISLQYGVPLDAFVQAFKGSQFEPSGRVEGGEYVTRATSLFDFVFRELYAHYTTPGTPAHEAENDLPTRAEVISIQQALDEAL